MAYEQEIYKKVMAEFEQERMYRKAQSKQRLSQVYEKCPKIREIDEEITKTGSCAAIEMLENPSRGAEIAEDLKDSMQMLSSMREKALSEAGFAADYTDISYRCIKCKDEGFIDGVMCECFKKRLTDEAYKNSNLFKLFETQDFKLFDSALFSDKIDKQAGISQKEAMEEALEICKSFVRDFDKEAESLFFYGGVGLGKTFLSTCIAKELIAREYSVVYQSSAKLFSYYNDYLFGRVNPSEGKTQIDRLRECDLLIIDDLGSEAANAQTVSFLFELVNDRILSRKKMVISTNYSIGEIASQYSERLHSRILESFIPVRFFGDDIRIKNMLKK